MVARDLFGFMGALVSGLAEAGFRYLFEGLRYKRDQRRRWYISAFEWATGGRRDSLRRADLRDAGLRGFGLASGEDRE